MGWRVKGSQTVFVSVRDLGASALAFWFCGHAIGRSFFLFVHFFFHQEGGTGRLGGGRRASCHYVSVAASEGR